MPPTACRAAPCWPPPDSRSGPAATSGPATLGATCPRTTRLTTPTPPPARGNVIQIGQDAAHRPRRVTAADAGARASVRARDEAAGTAAAALRRRLPRGRGRRTARAGTPTSPGWPPRRAVHARGRRRTTSRRWCWPPRRTRPSAAGFVAAPGRPWAWSNELQHLHVYHAVWSRDLYQIATALIAMGDRPAAANRALELPVDRAAATGRVVPAEQSPRRRAGLRRPADGRGRVPDRAQPPARRTRAATGPTSAGPRTSSSPTALARTRSAGRTSAASRPRRSPRRSPAWCAPRTSPARR